MIMKPPSAPASLREAPGADTYFKNLEKYLYNLTKEQNPPDQYLFSSPNRSIYAIKFNDDGSAYTELVQGADGTGTGTIDVTP